MNPQQRKYAMERIDRVAMVKISQAKKKYTTEAVTLKNEEKLKLIKDGAVKLKNLDIIKGQYCPDLYPSFDFSKHESPEKLDSEKYDKVDKTITRLAVQAKDNIMLGDASEALKIIAEMEAVSV
jgi:hypothetical protein